MPADHFRADTPLGSPLGVLPAPEARTRQTQRRAPTVFQKLFDRRSGDRHAGSIIADLGALVPSNTQYSTFVEP